MRWTFLKGYTPCSKLMTWASTTLMIEMLWSAPATACIHQGTGSPSPHDGCHEARLRKLSVDASRGRHYECPTNDFNVQQLEKGPKAPAHHGTAAELKSHEIGQRFATPVLNFSCL